MKEIELKAYAKINLGLDVLRKRSDGYHELRMIMQNVGIYDRIYIRRTRKRGIFLTNNLSFLPSDENNLVWKAARLLLDEFPQESGIYRFNAKFPMECKDYLQEMAWRNRCSITDYLIHIVQADLEAHPEWKDTVDILNR